MHELFAQQLLGTVFRFRPEWRPQSTPGGAYVRRATAYTATSIPRPPPDKSRTTVFVHLRSSRSAEGRADRWQHEKNSRAFLRVLRVRLCPLPMTVKPFRGAMRGLQDRTLFRPEVASASEAVADPRLTASWTNGCPTGPLSGSGWMLEQGGVLSMRATVSRWLRSPCLTPNVFDSRDPAS